MRILLVAIFALSLPAALYAAGGNTDLRAGNKAYDNAKYGEAFERYQAAEKAGSAEGRGSYNSGAALYKLKDYGGAAKAYINAAENSKDLKQSAYFNAGDAYYMQEDKKKAAAQFRQAVLLNPQDEEAIHNLQLVLEEEQKDQDKKNQDDKNDNQSPDQQQNPSSSGSNNSGQDKQQDKGGKDGKDGKPQGGKNPEDQKISKEEADSILQMLKGADSQKNSKPISVMPGQGNQAAGAPENTVEKDW